MPLANADEKAAQSDLLKAGKPVDPPAATWDEVAAAFARLVKVPGDGALRVSLAAIVANRLADADPVWLLLVAPSASAKTEYVMALSGVEGTYLLSQVTPNTFLSGLAGQKKDPSLLTRLGPQAIILQKDFTTVLSMRMENRAEILSQLREIFDGRFVREFGTGQTKSWEGRLGFISGVTLEIEQAIMTGSRLGDRFLYFRLPAADDEEAMKMAGANLFDGGRLREEVRLKVAGFLRRVEVPDRPPPLPEELLSALRDLCVYAVQARAPVVRDQSGRDIIDVPVQEGPARFYKELTSMCHALALIRGTAWCWDDYPLAAKLALDAVPRRRSRLVAALPQDGTWKRTAALALDVSLPTRTCHMVLDELECVGLAERRKGGDQQSSPDEWRLRAHAVRLLAKGRSPGGMAEAEYAELRARYSRNDAPPGQASIDEQPQL